MTGHKDSYGEREGIRERERDWHTDCESSTETRTSTHAMLTDAESCAHQDEQLRSASPKASDFGAPREAGPEFHLGKGFRHEISIQRPQQANIRVAGDKL